MFYASNNLYNFESVMNKEFKSVVKYFAINKLFINFSKTNYFLVSSSRLSVSINVNNIKIKSQIKYMGVYIDRYYVNLHTMKQLYYSFIYPYLTYTITSWESACKTRLNRIRTKQQQYSLELSL